MIKRNNIKHVITVKEKPKIVPRILPPMERPVTPASDGRSLSSAYSKKRQNVALPMLSQETKTNASPFNEVTEILSNSSTSDNTFAIQRFEQITKELQQITVDDLNSYNELYPLLSKLTETTPGKTLTILISALRNMIHLLEKSSVLKPKSPTSQSPRSKRLIKLQPLNEESSPTPTPPSQPKLKAIEHFNQFISKIYYKMSSDKSNDILFNDDQVIESLISLTSIEHKIETRTYSIAALKNECHSEQFIKKLVSFNGFQSIFENFKSEVKKPQLLNQLTGLCRNIILDPSNVSLLVSYGIHVHLVNSLIKFPEIQELVFNCFRTLTKLSGISEVRSSLLETFTSQKLVILFTELLITHSSHVPIVSRISYVYADFAAHEPEFCEVAGDITSPVDIGQISDLLDNNDIISNKEATALLLQVIANLSVNSKCSSILSLSEAIPNLLPKCTFKDDDRVGLNLLCICSNFTFHDNYWCPKELISAIPIALVSRNHLCIIESLRALCNIALKPNTMLVESKIPELLCILLRHVDHEIVIYSLQTLANLVNQAGMRRRLRAADAINAVMELLDAEEVMEDEIEAIAALIMNFGAITSEEAKGFLNKLDEFEIDEESNMVTAFRKFLKQQTLVDC
ncbi:hypothetical protein GPJ56_001834 [Histomonas meleagridis]|uniref:uncharacterized protein n=1 Tax=Histomonas meleagridis TaxID=135588 RepID=UPI00355AA520|nr:hypothetical protein GPJ56_001834 [Histomonas meleagridis]KAH0803229.1 hypothetical protein GO595_003965 [Histomonas meleagridis]